MYQKIVVPLDGSELAEVALPYAEELAGKLGSEVNLIYVSESIKDPFRRMHQLYLQKMVVTTKQGIRRYSRIAEGGQAIQAKSAILVGNAAEQIVEYTDKEDIGLIVMATHGRSGISRWAIGGVADKVVRATKRPVALIRAKSARPGRRDEGILKRLLVPLDGSKEGETVIPYIAEIASRLSAEIVLFQAVDLGYLTIAAEGYDYLIYSERQMESFRGYAKKYLDGVGDRLKQKGVTVKSEVRSGNAAEEIITLADEIHADMVAMSTHGRSGVGRWVFGSVAEKVLYEGNTPLLLVRVPKDTEK